jgi:hypothetical protein
VIEQGVLFGPAVTCQRCGLPLRFTGPGDPQARVLRRSAVPEGYCASCATACLLRHMEPFASMIRDPSVLLDPRVAVQFAAVLEAGGSDARPDEVDWRSVVANWDLPFPGAGVGPEGMERRKRGRR